MAFRNAAAKAEPILLKPIMEVEVTVPNDLMGDVIVDLSSRCGRILGTEPVGKNYTKVKAYMPKAEMFKYSATLNSMTQGRGSFTLKLAHYEEVPKELQHKIIEERKKELSQE